MLQTISNKKPRIYVYVYSYLYIERSSGSLILHIIYSATIYYLRLDFVVVNNVKAQRYITFRWQTVYLNILNM